MEPLYNMSGDRIWPPVHDDVMYGGDVESLLGEVPTLDMPTEYMSDREFCAYIDALFERYTGGSF
jgi:hypothetical protein